MKHIIGLVLAVVIIVCACSAPQTKTEENFEYYAPTKVFFGKDTQKLAGKAVKEQRETLLIDIDAEVILPQKGGFCIAEIQKEAFRENDMRP